MEPTYAIVDERRPSPVAHLAVAPYYPLLALMLGGAWIGWPWFALNAWALGSHTRGRELAVCVAAVVGTPALALFVGTLHMTGVIGLGAAPYLRLAFTVCKLGAGYVVHDWQLRAASLREHYDRPLRSGVGVVVLATFFRDAVLGKVLAAGLPLLYLVME